MPRILQAAHAQRALSHQQARPKGNAAVLLRRAFVFPYCRALIISTTLALCGCGCGCGCGCDCGCANRVNCSFYHKIGACRHGDRCSRLHNKPTFSQTIVMSNLYQNPSNAPANKDGTPGCTMNEAELLEHYDDFFEVSRADMCAQRQGERVYCGKGRAVHSHAAEVSASARVSTSTAPIFQHPVKNSMPDARHTRSHTADANQTHCSVCHVYVFLLLCCASPRAKCSKGCVLGAGGKIRRDRADERVRQPRGPPGWQRVRHVQGGRRRRKSRRRPEQPLVCWPPHPCRAVASDRFPRGVLSVRLPFLLASACVRAYVCACTHSVGVLE